MKRQTERFGGDDLAKRANKMAVGREFAAGVGSLKVCNDFVETLDDRGEFYTRIQSCTSLAKEMRWRLSERSAVMAPLRWQ